MDRNTDKPKVNIILTFGIKAEKIKPYIIEILWFINFMTSIASLSESKVEKVLEN